MRPWIPALCVLALAGCSAGRSTDDPRAASGRAVLLATPLPRPEFTLDDTNGQPFEFRARTAGTLTFLFFGYTHCPDVCPVHAANLAAALRTLSAEDRARTRVVFISADPGRDSAQQIRAWLDQFDPAFVGLRGPLDDVNIVAYNLHLPPASNGTPRPDGSYDVGHAATVVVFAPDDSARVIYPFGTRQADWKRDLPRLLRGERVAE